MRVALVLAIGLIGIVAVAEGGVAQEALPDGPGKAIVATDCVACHELTQVTAKRHSAAEWSALVDQMIGLGAPVTDAEKPVVIAYLTENYGPPSSAGGASAKVGTLPATPPKP